MKNRIGFIVPTKEFEERVIFLLKDSTLKENVVIEVLDEKKIIKQAKELMDRGSCAIIARGGTYHTLRDRINVPVINLNITTEDILEALNKAKKISSKIYLVIEETIPFEYREWQDLLNVKIERISFRDVYDIENAIKKIDTKNEPFVIVGGVVTGKIAEKYNYDFIFIDNSDNNIMNSLDHVEKFLMDIKRDSERAIRLESILNNIDDAVIVLSNEGNIEHFNRRSEILLGIGREAALGKYICDVVPDLGFVAKKRDVNNVIKEINKNIITVNTVKVEYEEKNIGVICTIQDITQIQKLEKKLRFELNKKGLKAKYVFEDIIVYEKSMEVLVEKAKHIADTDNTVVIYGESGTGKELFAQSIHNYSRRREEPFVAVNCAALSENLLESELFGYEEGAFTGARKGGKPGLFELSHGGTIFLDEINSISMNLQTKLLRVLEEKEVMRIGADYIIPLDTRIIAAANESLLKQVVENQFRKDLFFRLNVLELRIPSLRERKKEIIPLFNYFVSKQTDNLGEKRKIDKKLEEKLLNYKWVGNVRELKNVVERYCVMEFYDDYDELFSFEQDLHKDEKKQGNLEIDMGKVNRMVESLIIETLAGRGMSKVDIAKALGISRTALYKKMKKSSD